MDKSGSTHSQKRVYFPDNPVVLKYGSEESTAEMEEVELTENAPGRLLTGKGRFGPLVGSIDEGTSSTRFLVFAAKTAEVLTYHQVEIPHLTPEEGWCEQDPVLIIQSVIETVNVTCDHLRKLDIDPEDIVAVGITNQRETTILWDSKTGKPLYNAIGNFVFPNIVIEYFIILP